MQQISQTINTPNFFDFASLALSGLEPLRHTPPKRCVRVVSYADPRDVDSEEMRSLQPDEVQIAVMAAIYAAEKPLCTQQIVDAIGDMAIQLAYVRTACRLLRLDGKIKVAAKANNGQLYYTDDMRKAEGWYPSVPYMQSTGESTLIAERAEQAFNWLKKLPAKKSSARDMFREFGWNKDTGRSVVKLLRESPVRVFTVANGLQMIEVME
jgi:hypothetical protein